MSIVNANMNLPDAEAILKQLSFANLATYWMCPDIHADNPLLQNNSTHSESDADQVVYLSNCAEEVLDGPLVHKVRRIC